MEKYLGNKASLLPLMDAFIAARIPEASSLSDLFAGTTNVSRYFRARGWSTAACDANRFSYVLAQTYLGTRRPPAFAALRSCRPDPLRLRRMKLEFGRSFARYGHLYMPDRVVGDAFDDLKALAHVLLRLQVIGEANNNPGVITSFFTRWGSKATYESRGGGSGLRNYFSLPNALFLDGVLGSIREWWHAGMLNRTEIFCLLASVIEEVVITANVNGTFHDFNRDHLWPNAEQVFQLRLPLLSCVDLAGEIANAPAEHAAGAFARHDVCYLDPPYNFRQYTAYYHLLNFVAAYPFLADVEAYAKGFSFVRGQHREDDFSSAFCYKGRFIPSLKGLFETVDARHVVLSYFGGRNHWNHWSSVTEPTDEGLHTLQALFEDRSLFVRSEVVPALDVRRNYQSRSGERKGLVNEYLFHGELRARPLRRSAGSLDLSANVRWGLAEEFRHERPPVHDHTQDAVVAVG